MTTSPSKAKGSEFEREIATLTGGKRTPGSGAMGGGDITHDADNIWSAFSHECKRRKALPRLLLDALAQADYDSRSIGDNRPSIVWAREDGSREAYAFLRARDLVTFAEALADVGHGSKLREYARQLQTIAAEIRRMS